MNTVKEIVIDEYEAKLFDIKNEDYLPLDLSITNDDLSEKKLSTALDFENYITTLLKTNRAKIAFGGYLEERNLYKRSIIFNESVENERNIHLGIDFWTSAGTAVLAPLDGTVHSFKNNEGLGNYGPTIIIQHQIKDVVFYTLYGHLSLKSIENIEIGNYLKKGDIVGTLGNDTINGDYAPHLHFQIIKDLGNFWGDYPGVSSKDDLGFYNENCPNPNLLLKII